MLTAALILAAVLAVFAVALARAAGRPAPDFDAHAATACALLQPDAPALPDEGTPFADEVETWLARRSPTIRPAFPEES